MFANLTLNDRTEHCPPANRRNRRSFRTFAAAGLAAALATTSLGQALPFEGGSASPEWRAGRIEAALLRANIAGEDLLADAMIGSACIDLAQMSVLFAPETTAGDVRAMLERQPDEQFGAFQLQGSRWTATATNGGNIPQGAPITLTYSFIADGVNIAGFSGEPASASELAAVANAEFPGGFAAFKQQVRRAFDAWSAVSNITYVEVSDDGATFGSAAGALGARGDIRIGGHFVGGNVLAYNFFPQFGGDMVFDTSKFDTFANPSGNFRALHNVVAHEHGHGLGLNHVIPENGTKLMEPFLATGFEGPQEDDIRGVTRAYGDAFEANNTLATNFFVGGTLNAVEQVGEMQIVVEEASIERAGQSDFYGFTCFAGVPIAIRVDPLGTTYAQGPQGGSASDVDATSVRNLGLRLWRRTSAANQTFELFAQIDFNAAGEGEYHPPIPYTLAGFMVAEVFSNDGLDDVQRYALTISNVAIEAPTEPANMRVFEDGGEMGDSHTLVFGARVVGQTGTETIQIANDGTGVLELGAPFIQGPAAGDFSFTLIQDEVQPGDFVAMAIAFTPSQLGQRVAVISLPNNDPDRGDFSFIVSGTGLGAPQLEVQIAGVVFGPGSTFDFGDVTLGDSGSAEVVLRNTGTAPLNISSISLLGAQAAEYAIGTTEATIPAGGEVTRELTVTPSDVGPRNAQLRFISNSVPTGFSINLTTNGLAAIVDCNGNGIDDAIDIADAASADCDADGVPDECQADSDNDGVIDPCDQFPGQDDQLDSDGDGVVDAADGCPDDANKTQEGVCGCGVADADDDQDGVLNCDDAFPNDPFDGNGNENGNDNANGNDNGDQNDNDNDNNNNNNDNGNENDNANENDNGNENDNNGDNGQDEPNDPNLGLDDAEFDQDDDFEPRPFGLCGFGAGFASLMSMLAMAALRAPQRRR